MSEPEFSVVANDEDQFSIWQAGRELPAGWYDAGFTGTKTDCLAHIDRVWTDMRPRSLRLAMGENADAPSSRA